MTLKKKRFVVEKNKQLWLVFGKSSFGFMFFHSVKKNKKTTKAGCYKNRRKFHVKKALLWSTSTVLFDDENHSLEYLDDDNGCSKALELQDGPALVKDKFKGSTTCVASAGRAIRGSYYAVVGCDSMTVNLLGLAKKQPQSDPVDVRTIFDYEIEDVDDEDCSSDKADNMLKRDDLTTDESNICILMAGSAYCSELLIAALKDAMEREMSLMEQKRYFYRHEMIRICDMLCGLVPLRKNDHIFPSCGLLLAGWRKLHNKEMRPYVSASPHSRDSKKRTYRSAAVGSGAPYARPVLMLGRYLSATAEDAVFYAKLSLLHPYRRAIKTTGNTIRVWISTSKNKKWRLHYKSTFPELAREMREAYLDKKFRKFLSVIDLSEYQHNEDGGYRRWLIESLDADEESSGSADKDDDYSS